MMKRNKMDFAQTACVCNVENNSATDREKPNIIIVLQMNSFII